MKANSTSARAALPTSGSSRIDFGLTVRQLFGLVYVIERAALDELALDESFGATSEGMAR